MKFLFACMLLFSQLMAKEAVLTQISLKGTQPNLNYLQEMLQLRFAGDLLTQEKIGEIKCAIGNYFKDEGGPIVYVSIPSQEITDGLLKIEIYESKLGQIEFCGNRWFQTKQLDRMIRLKEGEPINATKVSEDLAWINRNPFRRTDAIFSPGKEPHTTDLKVVTWDRFPVRVYGGFDNRGNDGIGTERMFGGFYLGNFFHFDHRISYQYTCSLSFGRMYAHTLRYDMPLPWRHEISVFGGFSSVHLKDIGPHVVNRGNNQQASARYTVTSQKKRVSDYTFGYDFKRTNNNVEFSEIPIFASTCVISQFLLGYTYQSQFGCNVLFFSGELVGQPGDYLPHMSSASYQTLRPAATSSYVYGKAFFEFTHRFPKASLSLFTRLAGQLSTGNLLSSEEFGLGGADSVRGYKERIVNGDNAILTNLELRWDAFSLLRKKLKCPTCCESDEQIYNRRKLGDLFSFIAFFDYGFAHVHQKTIYELPCAYLMSAGPGVRYHFDEYVQAKLDWGIQLHKIPVESYGTRIHFTIIGSY